MRLNLKLTHVAGTGIALLLLLIVAPRHAWAQG